MNHQIGMIVYKDKNNKAISSQAIFIADEEDGNTKYLPSNSLFSFIQEIVKNEIF